MPRLIPLTHRAQQQRLREADAMGRALVTVIDGRLAVILPRIDGEDAQAEALAKISHALGELDLFGAAN